MDRDNPLVGLYDLERIKDIAVYQDSEAVRLGTLLTEYETNGGLSSQEDPEVSLHEDYASELLGVIKAEVGVLDFDEVGVDLTSTGSSAESRKRVDSVSVSRPYDEFEYEGRTMQSRLVHIESDDMAVYLIALTDKEQGTIEPVNIAVCFVVPELTERESSLATKHLFSVESPTPNSTDGANFGQAVEIGMLKAERAYDEFERAVTLLTEKQAKREHAIQAGDALPIEDIALGVRAYNILKRNGVQTVGGILQLGETGLTDLPKLGEKAQQEIVESLAELGFEL